MFSNLRFYMSTSLSAIIVYGINFDEENINLLPWHNNDFKYDDDNIYTWWEIINNYKPLFDRDNKGYYYLDGNCIGKILDYNQRYCLSEHKQEWYKTNQIPIKEIHYGYDYNNNTIITSPKYPVITTDFHYIEFDPTKLIIEEDKDFTKFCNKFLNNIIDIKPRWLLVARYW